MSVECNCCPSEEEGRGEVKSVKKPAVSNKLTPRSKFQPNKMPASLTYSGLTRHMTVAAATLKMTTPTAVDMVVICYISYQGRSRDGRRERAHHIRIRNSLPHIFLTPTPLHNRTRQRI
jgi:hypothetical protein